MSEQRYQEAVKAWKDNHCKLELSGQEQEDAFIEGYLAAKDQLTATCAELTAKNEALLEEIEDQKIIVQGMIKAHEYMVNKNDALLELCKLKD